MNENDQVHTLQSLLDHYRTKYYQTEFDYTLFQIQTRATISELENRVRELTTEREGDA